MTYDDATRRTTPTSVPPRPLDIDADDLAGAYAARRELGPNAEFAAISAFLERTGHAIDARVDQRVTQHRAADEWRQQQEPAHRRGGSPIALALGSMALGIPITAIALESDGASGVVVALVAWIAIAIINVAYQRNRM